MNPSTVLLLGDITGKGCVGLRMLTAQLERLGHEVLALPTALISNIFRLGSHESLETTDYLLRTLDTWAKLGIGYSVMYVGYVTGSVQARALCGVLGDCLRTADYWDWTPETLAAALGSYGAYLDA